MADEAVIAAAEIDEAFHPDAGGVPRALRTIGEGRVGRVAARKLAVTVEALELHHIVAVTCDDAELGAPGRFVREQLDADDVIARAGDDVAALGADDGDQRIPARVAAADIDVDLHEPVEAQLLGLVGLREGVLHAVPAAHHVEAVRRAAGRVGLDEPAEERRVVPGRSVGAVCQRIARRRLPARRPWRQKPDRRSGEVPLGGLAALPERHLQCHLTLHRGFGPACHAVLAGTG